MCIRVRGLDQVFHKFFGESQICDAVPGVRMELAGINLGVISGILTVSYLGQRK